MTATQPGAREALLLMNEAQAAFDLAEHTPWGFGRSPSPAFQEVWCNWARNYGKRLLAALRTTPAETGGASDVLDNRATFWVVEMIDDPPKSPVPRYWGGLAVGWTYEIDDALHFCRKRDAARWSERLWLHGKPVEHAYAPTPPSEPDGPKKEAIVLLEELLRGREFYGIQGVLGPKLETIRMTLARPSSPSEPDTAGGERVEDDPSACGNISCVNGCDGSPDYCIHALKRLAFAARTSGGTAGPDPELMAACDEAEQVLARVKPASPTADDIEGWLDVAIQQLDGVHKGWLGKAAKIIADGLAADALERAVRP